MSPICCFAVRDAVGAGRGDGVLPPRRWRGGVEASPEGYARAPTAAGLGGGKLGRAAQRELDGRAGRPETLPRGRRSAWESLGPQTLQ